MISLLATVALLAAPPSVAAARSCPGDTITRKALGEAMREARRADGNYDLLATTNSGRFQFEVLERLIAHALVHRPGGGTLFIPHDALWWEFLSVAGLGQADAYKAPIGRRLAYEWHQSIEVTYGPPGDIIKTIRSGQLPLVAANVRLEWPDRPDGLRKYSFVDTTSVPQLKVTNHQVQVMRFLVFKDMTVLDEIEGMSGRPLTGLLGTIFKIIGEGNVEFARFSISSDGLQVLRTKAKKLVSKTVTGTINPNGTGQNGVPEDRADLIELETRLKAPLEFDYYPYRCFAHPGS